MDKLTVTFRYNKKYDVVEMFFYDDNKDLNCFCMKEGHSQASYNYYLSNSKIDDIENNRDVDIIKKYYENYPNSIKLNIVKRLQDEKTKIKNIRPAEKTTRQKQN